MYEAIQWCRWIGMCVQPRKTQPLTGADDISSLTKGNGDFGRCKPQVEMSPKSGHGLSPIRKAVKKPSTEIQRVCKQKKGKRL